MVFGGARRGIRAVPLIGAVVALALVAGCGGDPPKPLSGEGDRPPKVKGPETDVDVCDLLPNASAASILDQPLQIVGVEYGASRVPTYRCMFGNEFAVPVLTVELATGPVAANVFEDAYGDGAGGDPEFLKRLGNGGFLRNENDQTTLHVLVRGAVISLTVQSDPAKPLEQSAIVEMTKIAIDRLPTNPQLAPTRLPRECSSVDPDLAAGAIGATPSLKGGISDDDGSLMCSWASQPGSATVTMLRSADRIRQYRRNLDPSLYVGVPELETEHGLAVVSRNDRAGDLVVFSGDESMAIINVIPSAGFADGSMVTTPGEIGFAQVVIALL